MCVGRSDQIPGPGDQRAESVGEGSVLLVRDEEGVLRAFANTCRHRGHELLPCGEAAQQKVIICPYHSWTYALDGGLRAAAGFKNQPGFVTQEGGLAELPLTAWVGGWMDLREGMATMSLDGTSHGAPLRGLDERGLRTVIYVNIFPNLLVSLHPDYVMVHRLLPLAADRTRIECTWAFAPESLA